MVETFDRKDLSRALESLKFSIEQNPPQRFLEEPVLKSAWARAVIKVEAIRVQFFPSISSSLAEKNGAESSLPELRRELDRLRNDSEFIAVTSRIPFQFIDHGKAGTRLTFVRSGNIPSAIDDIVSQIYVLERDDLAPIAAASGAINSLGRLKRILPDQKISPVQFVIINDKIAIAQQRAASLPEDDGNIRASKAKLLQSGEQIIQELAHSNYDKRLLDCMKELQGDLHNHENIIRLGLVNIGCEAMCSAFKDELPEGLRGLLLGHTLGVSMFVAQFPEWQRFSETAAAAEFGNDDIRHVSQAAKKMVEELESYPKIADPEVPRTIRALQHLIDDPKTATKRAAFAVLRTIENLISKIVEFGIDLIEKTTSKTSDVLSSAVSRASAVALLTIALGGAIEVSPIASKVTDTLWVKAAVDVVKEQIGTLKHGLSK